MLFTSLTQNNNVFTNITSIYKFKKLYKFIIHHGAIKDFLTNSNLAFDT